MLILLWSVRHTHTKHACIFQSSKRRSSIASYTYIVNMCYINSIYSWIFPFSLFCFCARISEAKEFMGWQFKGIFCCLNAFVSAAKPYKTKTIFDVIFFPVTVFYGKYFYKIFVCMYVCLNEINKWICYVKQRLKQAALEEGKICGLKRHISTRKPHICCFWCISYKRIRTI